MIVVYVSGAVARPGVYSLPEGSRVESAVSAAGGALPDADLEQINLAQHLADEEHISIYHKGEAHPTPPGSTAREGASATAPPVVATSRARVSPQAENKPPTPRSQVSPAVGRGQKSI